MADVFDLLTPAPALFGRTGWRSFPPCNFGKPDEPKAPKPPPPGPAPVRADSAMGEQAYSSAARREGLRKTVNPVDPLAPKTALGSMGALGMGGEGVMVNTAKPAVKKQPQTFSSKLAPIMFNKGIYMGNGNKGRM